MERNRHGYDRTRLGGEETGDLFAMDRYRPEPISRSSFLSGAEALAEREVERQPARRSSK